MKCVFCPTGETHCKPSSVTLERDGTTVVIQNVPGEVCDTCGEAYFRSCLEKEVVLLQALGDGQLEHGDPNHIFCGGDQNLEILRQSSKMAEPSKCSLNDPPFRYDFKLTRFSGWFLGNLERQFELFADKSFGGASIT